MKKSIAKNYLYNLAYQILIIILPLITTPYISRVLGAENIGIYSYTISISAYFILFGTLGINLYGQREIAYLQNDKKKYSNVFWEILILKLMFLSISMICFYFSFVYRNNSYSKFYSILLLEMIANIFDISWFLMGLEEFKQTVIINSLIKILGFIATFVFVKSKDNLDIYFWIYVISLLSANISMWLYVPKLVTKISFKKIKVFKHLKPTIILFIPQIAVQVYTLLDRTMIGSIITNKAEVGYYDQSQKIIKTGLVIVTALGTVMLPRIANDYANGNEKKISEYMEKSFNTIFLLSFPIISGMLAISDQFVPIFFGDGYERVALLIMIISPIIVFIGMSNLIGMQYLLTTGRQKQYTISVICGAFINFIMNLVLIPKYGAVGASIGTVVAEATVTSIQIYFIRNNFNFIKILKKAINYIAASALILCICKLLRMININDIISLILQIIVSSVCYFIILVIFKDKFVLKIIKSLKEKGKSIKWKNTII